MSKLRNKTYFTIYILLMFSILSCFIAFNLQGYYAQKGTVKRALATAAQVNKESTEGGTTVTPSAENVKYMDSYMYTILLDDDNSITNVINHSSNNLSDSKVRVIAHSILKDKKIAPQYVKWLYWNTFSYRFDQGHSLIIYDNTIIKRNLITTLEWSIGLFVLIEIITAILCTRLTNWITQPTSHAVYQQEQFVADASRELNTPLSVIIANSEILEKQPTKKKWLLNIRKEVERMNTMIGDLLELARSEQEDTVIPTERHNLSKLVELSVLSFEGRAYDKNIRLKISITDELYIPLHPVKITQLVDILLENALLNSPESSPIYASLSQVGTHPQLTIKNHGHEIPADEEDKIFDRFYRVDKPKGEGNNHYGLGLSVAKRIVTNHNGKISANSDEGITTFTVDFPAK